MASADKTKAAGIAAAVTLLAETIGQKQVSTVTINGWIEALDDLTIEQIMVGVRRALKTCKFMPTPVEIRELAGELKAQDRAVKAWGALELAVVQHGSNRTVDFDDPVINATVRNLGGWERVCTADAKEFDVFVRPKFLAAYASLYVAGVGEEESAPLQGGFDRENSRNGFEPQEPKKIVTGLPVPQRSQRIGNSNVPNIEGKR